MKDRSLTELCFRLKDIRVEQDKLAIEYNQIVEEIWDRIPSLIGDPNLKKMDREGNIKEDQGNAKVRR